jgi:hypothetical protein
LLNVGVLEIKSIEEFNPEQRTLDRTTIEVVPSTMKLKDLCVKPEVSLNVTRYWL